MRKEQAIFACGCFWGAQYQFERIKGVLRSTVGYIGGEKENPSYQEVKAHTTGHAEATQVEFDPKQVSYTDLCKVFSRYTTRHRPTDKVPISVRSTGVRYSTSTKPRSRKQKR